MEGSNKEDNHAKTLKFVLFFLLSVLPFGSVAQSSPSDEYAMTDSFKVSPTMTAILVALVLTFFMLGCFSVYVRRCTESFRPAGGGLLPLNDLNRQSRRTRHGLDPTVIDTFPTFLYSDVRGLKIGKATLECAVCLNEFEDEETLRLLPKCCHVFHPECIDTWLSSHVTCPVCRADLVPVPGEEAKNYCNLPPGHNSVAEQTRQPEVRSPVHEISELPIDLSIGSPEVINPAHLNNQNRPPRATTPKRPLVDGKFPRSHSTGHSLIQPGEDCERFTLRLPEDVQKKLMRSELRRAKSSSVAFPIARSPKKGFRSNSVGPGQGRNNLPYYERFDRESRPDRWGFSIAPPFLSRSRSFQSEGVNRNNTITTVSGGLLKSVKSPFDRLFGGTAKDGVDVGERSFTRLTGNSPV